MKDYKSLIGKKVFWVDTAYDYSNGVSYPDTSKLQIYSLVIEIIVLEKDNEAYVLEKTGKKTNLKFFSFSKNDAIKKYRKFIDFSTKHEIAFARSHHQYLVEQLNKLMEGGEQDDSEK